MRFLLDEPWLVFITVCIVLFTSSVVGYRLALSTRINEDGHHHEHITGLREGLFVLLGLLLGFTVAIVLPGSTREESLSSTKRTQSERLCCGRKSCQSHTAAGLWNFCASTWSCATILLVKHF
jgi:hypothetical protein